MHVELRFESKSATRLFLGCRLGRFRDMTLCQMPNIGHEFATNVGQTKMQIPHPTNAQSCQTRMMKIDFAPAANTPTPHFVLWDLGSRPFYLLASIFAAISVPLWVCQYTGFLPTAYAPSMVWHGHEMLFGYTLAVITGFLFTAVRSWTGQPKPTVRVLAAYALLWWLAAYWCRHLLK